MFKYFISCCICLCFHPVLAADFFVVDQHLPDSVKSLKSFTDLPVNKHEYKSEKGIISKCYADKQVLILSRNAYGGQGYELRKTVPAGMQCVKIADREFKNAAGIRLSMNKSKVLKLLNASHASNNSTLMYDQKKVIKHKEYDEQTWVDVEFVHNKLTRLAVFVSLTQ